MIGEPHTLARCAALATVGQHEPTIASRDPEGKARPRPLRNAGWMSRHRGSIGGPPTLREGEACDPDALPRGTGAATARVPYDKAAGRSGSPAWNTSPPAYAQFVGKQLAGSPDIARSAIHLRRPPKTKSQACIGDVGS